MGARRRSSCSRSRSCTRSSAAPTRSRARTARFPHFSHGNTVGYAVGWLWWLGAVTVAPIEVEAALQYFTHYIPWLTTTAGGETVSTAQGYGVAVLLMAVFTVVNVLGVRWLARANTPITAWKLAIPLVAIAALLATRFHSSNFSASGGFMPFGWHGVFSAMATGGVIFAYQGFEQAVQLGGESARPRRNIPISVIGAMLIGVAVYMLLQVAFIGALEPSDLKHGWTKLAFNGLVGPFAGLASRRRARLARDPALRRRRDLARRHRAALHRGRAPACRTRSAGRAGGPRSSAGSRGAGSR